MDSGAPPDTAGAAVREDCGAAGLGFCSAAGFGTEVVAGDVRGGMSGCSAGCTAPDDMGDASDICMSCAAHVCCCTMLTAVLFASADVILPWSICTAVACFVRSQAAVTKRLVEWAVAPWGRSHVSRSSQLSGRLQGGHARLREFCHLSRRPSAAGSKSHWRGIVTALSQQRVEKGVGWHGTTESQSSCLSHLVCISSQNRQVRLFKLEILLDGIAQLNERLADDFTSPLLDVLQSAAVYSLSAADHTVFQHLYQVVLQQQLSSQSHNESCTATDRLSVGAYL